MKILFLIIGILILLALGIGQYINLTTKDKLTK